MLLLDDLLQVGGEFLLTEQIHVFANKASFDEKLKRRRAEDVDLQ